MHHIPIDELRKVFSHDAEAGTVTWHVTHRKGMEAGYIRNDGYKYIQYKGTVYLFHRLIWALHHGEWPTLTIDHINYEKADNRLSNLRLATVAQNIMNRPALSNNKTGYKGVCLSKASSKYVAKIRKDGKITILGYFDTAEKAHEAYKEAAKEIHGEFARY